MHVIVNWGGKVDYDLSGICNLTRMLKSNGQEVSIIEKDPYRQRWLQKHLGINVVNRNTGRSTLAME